MPLPCVTGGIAQSSPPYIKACAVPSCALRAANLPERPGVKYLQQTCRLYRSCLQPYFWIDYFAYTSSRSKRCLVNAVVALSSSTSFAGMIRPKEKASCAKPQATEIL
jgi:hypothetical protein